MQFPLIDPIAFSVGPLNVHWYALAYLGGVALGVLYGLLLLRSRPLWPDATPPFTAAQFIDFGFWAVIGIILGGRIGYVLFYQPAAFAQNPIAIFEVWNGGMSFHGGLLGMIVAMIFFARSTGANTLSAFDLLAAVAPLGLMLGRIANFINGELYGRETNLPWGIIFPGGGDVPRHPSQLYEAALEGLILFLVLRLVTHVWHGFKKPGLVAGIFGIGYALSRILVEQVRLPDAFIGYLYGGWLTLGMLLTLPVLLAGVGLVIYALTRPQPVR
ncbi:MAG: prolipoprotein diacylglyceryl transferase [Hyphomicrobiaceae bacterium]|nr:prolipoprotein diacylglyceryl transferase [Hyphomicrobiaceae bacterium]MCC0023283.1 prolipoprotein diacylglyceryl transferase [Hyphomicrobiaceae bacterium]